jgi:signal transduction histidine kinase
MMKGAKRRGSVRSPAVRSQSAASVPDAFENLISGLSTAFAGTLASEIDNEITRWLKQIVLTLNLDRAGVFQIDASTHRVYVSHQWQRPGVQRVPTYEDFRQIAPSYVRRLLDGEAIVYSHPDKLPRGLKRDLEAVKDFAPRSHAAIPLQIGGTVVGAVGFATVTRNITWSANLLKRLHLIAEIFGNVLERKRADLAQVKLREEVAHISRLVSVSELAASVAHELNQPIAAILSNAEAIQSLLESERPDLVEVRTAIGEIIQDDTRAAETIRRLRALFRRDQLERAPLDLGEVVSEIGRLVRSNATIRNVSFVLDSVRTLPRVLADRVQLRQAILNLVLNAFEAVGGVERGPREVTVKIFRGSPGKIVIAVSDSGPGIDPSVLPRIFDPFFTTKPSGIGMGLAISRSIIEAHGGRLSVTPDSANGATFVAELPTKPMAQAAGIAAAR